MNEEIKTITVETIPKDKTLSEIEEKHILEEFNEKLSEKARDYISYLILFYFHSKQIIEGKDKEIERLNKELESLEKLNNANYQSFIEVNNIINELEKYLRDMFNKTQDTKYLDDLTKLWLLKGSDKE